MSVVSTANSFAASSLAASDVEFQIKLIQDEIMVLAHEAKQAVGDKRMQEALHNQEQKLQQELKQLEMEYQVLKQRLEGDEKMRKEALTRGFKLNI